MGGDEMTPVAMLEQCAPQIAPVTMSAIVQQESGGNPLVLHDNTSGKSYRPATVADAARIARELIAQGHSVDIGLAQINSKNLPRLGLGVDQVLDPCANLHAAQTVLMEGWKRSGDLRATLSVYNTGKLHSPVGGWCCRASHPRRADSVMGRRRRCAAAGSTCPYLDTAGEPAGAQGRRACGEVVIRRLSGVAVKRRSHPADPAANARDHHPDFWF
jgi:type IV secretion system protein VirB1